MNKKAAVITSPLDCIILLSVSSSEECLASKEGNGLGMFGEKFVWKFTGALNHKSDFSELLLHVLWEEDFSIGLLSAESVDGS